MAEYRWEPVTGTWTMLAPGRSGRPMEFRSAPRPVTRPPGGCPFCAGNESQTPPPVDCYPPARPHSDWQVRVVPNLYPAIDPHAPPPSSGEPAVGEPAVGESGAVDPTVGDPDSYPTAESVGSPLIRTPAFGHHEVVIVSAEHVTAHGEIGWELVLWELMAIRDRMRTWAKNSPVRYVQAFQNCGADAGASIEHLHSQLIALPAIPAVIQRELRNCQSWRTSHGECLICRLAQEALSEPQFVESGSPADGSSDRPSALPQRVVRLEDGLLAWCPYASRWAYECWIQPLEHASRFESIDDDRLAAVSRMLHRLLVALERVRPSVAYNWWLHTSPFDRSPYDHYHWHIELFPRISRPAGFEWGAGWTINPVEPAHAAQHYRRCWPDNSDSLDL